MFRAVVGRAQWRFDQRLFVEAFGIDLAPVDGREDAEAVVCKAHVVAVRRSTRRDDAAAFDLADERRVERLNQLRLSSHAANPTIRFNCHKKFSAKSRVLTKSG